MARVRFKNVHWMLIAVFVLLPTTVVAQQVNPSQSQSQPAAQTKTEAAQGQTEGSQTQAEKDAKVISGMSILGNQDAPKSLVIVPWKSSELGDAFGISTMLDDSRQPIDKEVFMRMLSYYEIRSETTRPGGVPTKTNAAQPANATPRRKP